MATTLIQRVRAAWLCIGLGACAPATVQLRRPLFAAPPDGVFFDPVLLVASTEDDLLPTLSNSANLVAYAARNNGNLDIVVRPLQSGTAALRLTQSSTDDSDPAFSPDGGKIAWVSQSEDVKGDIWVMGADGGDKQRLTDRKTADQAPAWSADGQTLYFTCRTVGSATRRIDSYNLETKLRRTVVTNGWDPSLSPDGNILFYVRFSDPEGRTPQIRAQRLADGAEVWLAASGDIEAAPHAGRDLDGTSLVLFSRFVDDTNHDGTITVDDAPSLWSMRFADDRFSGSPAPAPTPLTPGEGGEIFAAVLDGFMVYTAAGRGELALLALPLGGIVNSRAAPQKVLEAARSTRDPALRRLALRHVVARDTALAATAHYELARELAERQQYAAALTELAHSIQTATNPTSSMVARLEQERLTLLQALHGRWLARRPSERAMVEAGMQKARALAQSLGASEAVQIRLHTLEAEALLALRQRAMAVTRFEDLAATMPKDAKEDGARVLDALGQVYEQMQEYSSLSRVCSRLLREFESRGYYAERAAQRWVGAAQRSLTLAPAAALQALLHENRDVVAVAARAAAALARLQDARGQHSAALATWQRVAASYSEEREILADALENIGKLAAQSDPASALDAYERLLELFATDWQKHAIARAGIAAITLQTARSEERENNPTKALRTYEKLLQSNPEMVGAVRRTIALSAQLHELKPVLERTARQAAAQPQNIYARYAYGYALTFATPPKLVAASAEMEAVLDLEPRFAAAQLTLGWIRSQRERQEPGRGWLEEAAQNFDTARSLLDRQVDTELWGAATLNMGNTLFALGKLDEAFRVYLERELSQLPFESPVAEVLFRESFSRVALRVDSLDVALDMAYKARELSLKLATVGNAPRVAALASLLGALNLQSGRLDEALRFYREASQRYIDAHDWARVVPALRGEALALRAQGEDAAALTTLQHVLAILARGNGPPPAPTGALRKEIPANPLDITAAVYGFDTNQEEGIARATAARIFESRLDYAQAAQFSNAYLALLRQFAADSRQGPRIQLELFSGLHGSARVAAKNADYSAALDLWAEALPLGVAAERWHDVAILLSCLQEVWSRAPQTRQGPLLGQALEAAALATRQGPAAERPRFARFLSLSHLALALRQPPAGNPRSPDDLRPMLRQLDEDAKHLQLAQKAAAVSGDGDLQAHVQHFSPRPKAPSSSTDNPAVHLWRALFDRALWDHRPEETSSRLLLSAAARFYAQPDAPVDVPEHGAFVQAVATSLYSQDPAAAWGFFEKERLRQLQPRPERLQHTRLAAAYNTLRQTQKQPDAYAAQLREASTLLRAVLGEAVPLATLQRVLPPGAALLQVFAPTADLWHWFLIDRQQLLRWTSAPAPQSLPAAVVAALAAHPPQLLYVDSGEVWDVPATQFVRRSSAHVGTIHETLSASYLVASYEALHWDYPGTVTVSVPVDDPSPFAWMHGVENHGLLHLPLQGHWVGGAKARPGLSQVTFTDAAILSSNIDLNSLANQAIRCNTAWVSAAPTDSRSVRGIAQSLLLAEIPSSWISAAAGAWDADEVLANMRGDGLPAARDTPTQLRIFGPPGLTADAQVELAARTFVRVVDGIAVYKKARANPTAELWMQTLNRLQPALAALEFLLPPAQQARARLSGNEQVTRVVALLSSAPSNVRGMLAEAEAGLGHFSQAVALRQTVLQTRQAQEDDDAIAEAHFNLGKTLFLSGRHQDAARRFDTCAKFAHVHKRQNTEAECLKWLGDERRFLNDYAGAETAFRAALDLLPDIDQTAVRRSLGRLYLLNLNNYDKAEEQFARALKVAHGDIGAEILLDMAQVKRRRGDYEEALQWLEAARQKADIHVGTRAIIALETANIDWYRGDYRGARTFQESALKLAQQSGKRLVEAEAQSLRGLIALNEGDLSEAESAITEALSIARSMGERGEEATQLNNLGIVQREAGRMGDAMQSFRQALGIDESRGDSEGRAYDLRNLAIALHLTGRNAEAAQALESALALSRTIGNRYNELQCLLAQGDILEGQRNSEGALAKFAAAAQLARLLSVPEAHWRALYALGRIRRDAGDLSAARQLMSDALAVAERLGRGNRETLDNVAHSRDELYADAMGLALAAKDLVDAFNIAERGRSRALLDVLASRTVEVPEGQGRRLLAATIGSQEKLQSVLRRPNASAEQQRMAQSTYDTARNTLLTQAPKLARAFTIAPLSAPLVQSHLPPGVGILSYYVGRTQTVAMVQDANHLQAFTLPISQTELATLTDSLEAAMRAFGPMDSLLQQAADQLIRPFWAALSPLGQLVIVPHGPLHGMPFAALPLAGAPLLEHMALSLAATVGQFADTLTEAPEPPPKRVAALAPAADLPFARLEALSVAQPQRVHLSPQANRAALTEAAAHSDALDLAAHLFIEHADPLASALQLDPTPGDNGRLELRQVFGQSGWPRRITLSACDGLGAAESDWLGLGQGFLLAGARTVVASHSRVSDLATGLLMKHYYRLLQQEPAAEALQHAAMQVRERYKHPAHWANFMLLGDPR